MDANAMMRPHCGSWQPAGTTYEYRVVTMGHTTSPTDASRLLTDEAEYGRWELARTRLSVGGRRKVWLRRKIIRVQKTF